MGCFYKQEMSNPREFSPQKVNQRQVKMESKQLSGILSPPRTSPLEVNA